AMVVEAPLLTAEEYALIEQPIESARTLPRRAFCDERFFEFEVENLLVNSWIAVGFHDQLPQAGDVRPVNILGRPVLLVRNRAGQLRAFHNIVPYDSCEVVTHEAHGLQEIITPYHGLK